MYALLLETGLVSAALAHKPVVQGMQIFTVCFETQCACVMSLLTSLVVQGMQRL